MNKVESLKVVNDQQGSPTWTKDLAALILIFITIDNNVFGTYHFSGEGECSWYNFAEEIYRKGTENSLIPSECTIYYEKFITFVKDRPGHDQRYAINCDKLKNELGWKQSVTFDEGLRQTVRWYLQNRDWIENIKSGEYLKWMETNYTER